MNSDLNSDMKSNFNTYGRTDGRYEESPSVDLSTTGCNARARMSPSARTVRELLAEDDAEREEPTEDDIQKMARLLAERESRHSGADRGNSIAQVLDRWLERTALNHGQRWPVIRTGEREPIPWPLRASILERDGYSCKSCGWHDTEGFELDHCIPWSAGGPDDSDNLRTLCRRCNQERSNFIDSAHMHNLLPTTYWCIDCWTYENHQSRRWWKDQTDLGSAPWVASEDGGPMRLVFCGWCRYTSTSDLYFVGQMGRDLLEQATRFVRKAEQ